MSAPRGNQFAKGNKGGRPSKYKSEFAETAQKLCARFGYTDQQLAEWFDVSVRTIAEWKLKHDEFSQALRAGKSETDDLVARSTVAHITGYYVDVEEMDRHGNVHTQNAGCRAMLMPALSGSLQGDRQSLESRKT